MIEWIFAHFVKVIFILLLANAYFLHATIKFVILETQIKIFLVFDRRNN